MRLMRRATPRPSRSQLARVGWLVFCIGIWIQPATAQKAHAGACCASAAAFGVGRLLRWEKFAVGYRSTLINHMGRWNLQGKWLPKLNDYTELSWRSELWGMVKIVQPLSVYVRFPWMLNHRRSDKLSEIGGGIADMHVGLRWDIIGVAQHKKAPGIALTLDLLMPTGRRTTTKATPLGTGITGRGAWALSAGLLLEKVIMPWFIQLQTGIGVPLPFHREDLDLTQRFGINFQAALANGWEIVPNALVLSLVLRFLWEGNIQMGERYIEDSYRIDLGALVALAWRFREHWTLQLSFDTGIFTHQLGHNENGRLTTLLGIRYGYF